MIPGKNHNRVFSFGVLIAYCAAGVVAILRHAMWRDEVFPWLLARDSHSFRELLINVRHDSGHLPLWHFLLWLVTRFTTNPVAEQILHLSIAALAVWLFLYYSPFSKTQKLLFAFGYFPLFEYCVVCRMYSIVWLLLFAFCACFESRHRTYLPLAGILSLMALTTTLGTVLALAFAGALVLEARTHRPPRGDVLLSASVFAVALFLAAVFLWQHVDHPDVRARG